MSVNIGDMIGAAVLATLLTGFGIFYVFQIALARGEKAGFFAAGGLSLGLLIFANFPVVRFAFELVHLTQFYQKIRIIIVVLAIILAIFTWLDYGYERVERRPSVWTLSRVFILGLLVHLITPLPFNMYDQLLSTPKIATALSVLAENFINTDKLPKLNPIWSWVLPVVSFLIYGIVAYLAGLMHEPLIMNDRSRRGLRVIFVLVFVAIILYVGFTGLTYDQSLFDKVTDFGINRFLKN